MQEETGRITVSFVWRLRKAMADANVWKTSDLKEKLDGVGVRLTAPNVSRLINRMPKRLSMEVLAGLLTVLDCGIADLIEVVRTPAGGTEGETGGKEEHQEAKPKTRKTKEGSAKPKRRRSGHEGKGPGLSLELPKITPIPEE
jgi:DNA-binding Xre family transcriptional regulator